MCNNYSMGKEFMAKSEQQIFKLHLPFEPSGDQPGAIKSLCKNRPGWSVLLGVTGSGKTFTLANVIAKQNKPVLILSPNKTLAAQLYEEFSLFFPENKVCYFVSYYDYYQPESYLPAQDIYVPKETKINTEIERLRVETTASIINRPDTIVIASVSAIYSLGNPFDYKNLTFSINKGDTISRKELIHKLIFLQYKRNDVERASGTFSVLGNTITVILPYLRENLRIEMFGDTIESIELVDKHNYAVTSELDTMLIFPAKHFVTTDEKRESAIVQIKADLKEAAAKMKNPLYKERLITRVNNDIEMLEETGYCNGIENYSRYFSGMAPGQRPYCLFDFFKQHPFVPSDQKGGDAPFPFVPSDFQSVVDAQKIVSRDISELREANVRMNMERFDLSLDTRSKLRTSPFAKASEDRMDERGQGDFLLIIDESHIAIPQLSGMYKGDRSRKKSLVDFGFRLPAAFDNRPLKFEEIETFFDDVIFVSATPGEYEVKNSLNNVEQIVRPTGIVDPEIEIVRRDGQIDHLIEQIKKTSNKGFRTLVTVLTKKMAEILAEYLEKKKIKVCYMHSDIKTPQRTELLQKLRLGVFECLVGINLLREGLDLPEVALVAIMDADIEGFLRDSRSLIQTIGRAARNTESRVIFYADKITKSIERAIEETDRRREVQQAYNEAHGITPKTVKREVGKSISSLQKNIMEASKSKRGKKIAEKKLDVEELKRQMQEAAENLDFERAIKIRDLIRGLRLS